MSSMGVLRLPGTTLHLPRLRSPRFQIGPLEVDCWCLCLPGAVFEISGSQPASQIKSSGFTWELQGFLPSLRMCTAIGMGACAYGVHGCGVPGSVASRFACLTCSLSLYLSDEQTGVEWSTKVRAQRDVCAVSSSTES